MSRRTLPLDDRLHDYLLANSLREHPCLRALRDLTERHEHGGMQSSPEQVQLLALLIELMGATRVLEVGCFTGYGTLGMALALPPDGRIVTLDVNEDWAAIGRRFWREAGVEGRIELRLGLAQESLDALLAERGPASFDLAYIDADKKGYDEYWERV
ncbi:MAG TPA: class I SAM-dependent methyltransferase, partial [Geminicoccaceae bacterium]|nr:class I SAM-dependent methyltransferase [Geminicoccaceae bacterium]